MPLSSFKISKEEGIDQESIQSNTQDTIWEMTSLFISLFYLDLYVLGDDALIS